MPQPRATRKTSRWSKRCFEDTTSEKSSALPAQSQSLESLTITSLSTFLLWPILCLL
jgi:hypothetical protein